MTGVFQGDPVKYWQKWAPGSAKEVFSEPVPGSSVRYKINFVMFDEASKKFVAKVWEFTQRTSNMLFDLNEELDLSNTKVKVTRRGSTKDDTTYTIVPLGDVPAKALKEIQAVPLHVLEAKAQEPQEQVADDSELPF
jgi:hypothetical protein